jgi:hypothetical protein
MVALAIVLLALLIPSHGRIAGEMVDSLRNLTYTFDEHTIYWPTEKGFVHQFEKNGDTPQHYFYS